MKRTSGYTYQAILPAADIKEDCFKYNIIVCRGDSTHTYPVGNSVTGSSSGIQGSPLTGTILPISTDYTCCRFW